VLSQPEKNEKNQQNYYGEAFSLFRRYAKQIYITALPHLYILTNHKDHSLKLLTAE